MGRGGVGAVMGSKKIKAFILDETGTSLRQPLHPVRFKAAAKIFNDGLRSHGISGQGLPLFGTNVLTNILNEVGGYPTRNFSSGQFEGAIPVFAFDVASQRLEAVFDGVLMLAEQGVDGGQALAPFEAAGVEAESLQQSVA